MKNITMTHRELVCPILVRDYSYFYQVTSNNKSLFPWMHVLASSFEKYRLTQLSLEYIPACGTTAAGLVYLAYDYDPSDVKMPLTPQYLTNMQGTITGNVFASHVLNVDVNRFRKDYYTGTKPVGASINDYSCGNILLLTSNASVAELG